MYFLFGVLVLVQISSSEYIRRYRQDDNSAMVGMMDLTKPTTWKDLSEYYLATERHWKVCVNCGIPGLGTNMHIDTFGSGSMQPALIPTEYLVTRLVIIDVSYLVRDEPSLVLSLEVALQWMALKNDPKEPTLLLFKFGWNETSFKFKSCVCKIPGLSYDLAHWIATNLSHVVGVATDAPSLESEQTREFTTRTISQILGTSGIYMIENVNLKRRVPEHGCMTIAMPMKLLHSEYVPTRLIAFCPTRNTDQEIVVTLKRVSQPQASNSRRNDVSLDEIMN